MPHLMILFWSNSIGRKTQNIIKKQLIEKQNDIDAKSTGSN